jgi:hypothetical protein
MFQREMSKMELKGRRMWRDAGVGKTYLVMLFVKTDFTSHMISVPSTTHSPNYRCQQLSFFVT